MVEAVDGHDGLLAHEPGDVAQPVEDHGLHSHHRLDGHEFAHGHERGADLEVVGALQVLLWLIDDHEAELVRGDRRMLRGLREVAHSLLQEVDAGLHLHGLDVAEGRVVAQHLHEAAGRAGRVCHLGEVALQLRHLVDDNAVLLLLRLSLVDRLCQLEELLGQVPVRHVVWLYLSFVVTYCGSVECHIGSLSVMVGSRTPCCAPTASRATSPRRLNAAADSAREMGLTR